ncbi:MAG: hypothetical protein K1X48_05310 [Burkholderiaceae bacterium]|nr:hypothetical protein [Burkholderiaceae bacterium]
MKNFFNFTFIFSLKSAGYRYSQQLLAVFLLLYGFLGSTQAQQMPDFDNIMQQGVNARERKEFGLAIDRLQQARVLSPDDPRPILELAVTYEWAGRLGDAQALYENLLKTHTKNLGATLGLARVLRWRWQFEQALLYYERTLLLEQLPLAARVEAELGIAQINRLQMRLDQAHTQLQEVLRLDPLNSQALDELKQLEATSKHRLLLLAGNREGSAGSSLVLRAEWLLQQDAKTLWRFGAGRNTGAQQALVTDMPNNDRQNVVFVEQTYAIPQALTLQWRGEYRNRIGQANEYQLQGTGSDQVNERWRVNAGFIVAGSSSFKSQTLLAGLSARFAQYWDAGLTGYVSNENDLATKKTWLARLQWEREGVLAQAFVSRELGQAAYKQTFLVNWPFHQNYRLRLQATRDGVSKVNSWFVGVDIPIGSRASVQFMRENIGSEQGVYVGANLPLRYRKD